MTHICVNKLTNIGSSYGLSPPSHFLNQWWNIVNLTLRNTLQWNVYRNTYIFIQENAFENVVRISAAILSRPQCVQYSWFACFMPSHHSMHYSVRQVKRNWHATANISGYRPDKFSVFTFDTMTSDWLLRHNTINFDNDRVMDGYWYAWALSDQREYIRKTVIKQDVRNNILIWNVPL